MLFQLLPADRQPERINHWNLRRGHLQTGFIARSSAPSWLKLCSLFSYLVHSQTNRCTRAIHKPRSRHVQSTQDVGSITSCSLKKTWIFTLVHAHLLCHSSHKRCDTWGVLYRSGFLIRQPVSFTMRTVSTSFEVSASSKYILTCSSWGTQ